MHERLNGHTAQISHAEAACTWYTTGAFAIAVTSGEPLNRPRNQGATVVR